MRITVLVALLGLAACSKSNPGTTTQAVTCDSGDTVVYTNRFAPAPGGSGVATGPDAQAGKINSDSSSGGAPSSGAGRPSGASPSAPSLPSSPAPAPTTSVDPNAPLTAMVTSCQPSMCSPGQVAVEVPPAPGSSGGGIAGGPSTGPSATPDVGTTDGAPPTPIPAPPTPPTPLPPAVVLTPPGTLLCVSPPPDCGEGLSPQFTSKGDWECTDCALVVTYGGIYGNYRRCVNEPQIVCTNGQTPTWVFEDEQWECKTTCDNGQYDQHTVSGTLVCVPC